MADKTKTTKPRSKTENLWRATEVIVSSRLFLCLTLLWFFIQAIYMALSTRPGLPPDENYHVGFINLFTKNGWSPFIHNQAGYFSLGEVVHTPYFLYHYLLSLPNHIFIGSGNEIFYLRFINILLSLCSLWVLYKLAMFIKMPKIVANLSVFMMANTLMFVFLSAAVNYDNLFILLTLSSVLFFFKFNQKKTLAYGLALLLCLLAGLLTKVNFLPVAIIILALTLYDLCHNFREILGQMRITFAEARRLNIILAIIIVALGLLFIQRFVVNSVRYHAFSPRCTQALRLDQCRQNPVFARNEKIANSNRPSAQKSFLEYISDWTLLMIERTFGLFTPKTIEAGKLARIGTSIFLILGLVATIRKFSPNERTMSFLLIITLFYIAALMFTNYRTYQNSGSFTFAVQGRYWFAVLPVFYLIGNTYILRFLRGNNLKLTYLLVIFLSFLSAGLPTYIYKTPYTWHTSSTTEVNAKLKDYLSRLAP